ncbi:MAG TPA: efflux RND transporter periplasmic adaptor subunit [Arenibacter sp.]|nr:efflux RND transporter periplasmic adaptor subunit [Arenibacter sp.]
MNNRTKYLAHLSFIILLILISGCAHKPTPAQQNEKDSYCLDENFRSKVEFERPKKKMVTEDIHLTGAVESNPDKVVHFMSLVDGIIFNTYFLLGDHVQKGQVLAELQSAELSDLYAQSKVIESQLEVARENLKATQSMFDDGISSQRNLLEARSELAILKAEKEKIATILNLFSANPENGTFQIKASHSGIVTTKSIASGTPISAGGELLFTISDLSEVWITMNIYASGIQDISIGMEVAIQTLSYPDETFNGTISAISQVLDEEAKVLKARMVLPNTDLKLKPGMLVDVIALKKSNIEALGIPTGTMVFDNNQNYVVVYKDDCDIEIRKVEILSKGNGTTFIAKGLKETDILLSKNQLLIHEQIKNFQN